MTWGGSLRADRPGAGQRPVFHGIGNARPVRRLILTITQARQDAGVIAVSGRCRDITCAASRGYRLGGAR